MSSDSTDKNFQESEKLYHMLFEYSMDGIILTDPREGGKILSANPAACRMLGWTEEELIGKGRDIMFDLKDPLLSGLLEKCARSGSARARLTYRRRDGTTFPGEVSTACFIDNDGEPRTVAIIRDITERKQAEEALSRERSLLESVTHATDLMLALFDPQFNFVWVNPAYAKASLMKPEEMVGKNHFALYPHEENEAIFRKVRDTGEGVFYKDKPFTYPDQPERGVTYWDWNLAPVKSPDGNVTGLVLSLRETTKYKQAEEALRKSEEHYRMLFTNMTEGFALTEVIFDEKGKPYDYRYLEVNPVYERSTGLKKEQVLGKSILMVIPDISPIMIKKLGETAVSGEPTYFEIFSQITDNYFDVYVFSPEKGKVAATFRDITKRKQAEEALKKAHETLEETVKERTLELQKAYNSLKESEKGLAEAQRMAHLGSWKWDITTDKLYWSDETYRIFGRKPQEFNATYDAFLSYVHPEDRDYVHKAVKKALYGEPYFIDFRIVSADGGERTVSAHGEVVFNEENIPILMRGTVQDITEHKKAEERIQRLADIVESSNDAIITKTPEGIITSWNKGAERIYGYSAKEILGKNISILEPENLRGEIKKLTQNIMDNEDVKHYETLRLRKDGKLINISVTLSPIHNTAGRLVAISAIARDITERKRAEEALAKLEKIRIKEIHHRIKNNLQVISSLLDLQSEAFSHLDVCKVPEVIEAFAESQNRVISMALIHEELYKGEKLDNLDFSAYLRKLTKELFNSYNPGDKDIIFKLDLEQADLGMDTAIPLGIIVNELVSNAFKHAFHDLMEGEIRINLCRIESTNSGRNISGIDKSCIEKDGFKYKLKVSDNGKGIPEEIDIENTDSLGLQLVNLLVEQIDGCFEVKSNKETEKGTELTIWFSDIDI
ncbi:PAS domain S-box protein [Methanosarcina hadiensis]|uniref:PAS domain-containing sensor histidine kinase n=1 Tax=Methanosarcina hadiensis TaxID=3078083 RepID=UPI003977E27E